MGRYTNIELKEMKETEPERAFYFSHEDEFMKMGIDLTLDNWDSVLQTSMVPSPNENRYAFFMRSLRDGGVTVIDGENNLRKIQLDDTRKDPLVVNEIKDSPDALPQFPQEQPHAPQKPHLSFGAHLLELVTLGIYKAKARKQYDKDMQEFGRQMLDYNKKKDAFDNDMLRTYRPRSLAMQEYEKTLSARGKTPEMQKSYRKALEKHAADYQKIKSEEDSIEKRFADRTLGEERLDFIFGPTTSPETTTKMIAKCGKAKVFQEDCFGEPQKNDNKQRLKMFNIPKDCPFNAHEIALLGYSATCNYDVWLKTAKQPDPNKPAVKKELTKGEALTHEGLWYNMIDGIVTRREREASGAIPVINYAKSDAMAAIEKYMKGDPTDLGKIICDGIHRSVDQVVIQDVIDDKNSFPDYGRICGELLKFVDKGRDSKLYDAITSAGLTSKDIEAAKICKNIGEVYDKGLTAFGKLASNNDLTYKEKLSAIADVAGMRLTQQILAQRKIEMDNSPAYKQLSDEWYGDMDKAQKEVQLARKVMDDAQRNNAPNFEEKEKAYNEKHEAYNEAVSVYTSLNMSFVAKQFGVDVSPNKQMCDTFGADNSPQGLHDMYLESETFKKLAEKPSSEIFREMTQEKASKHLQAVKAETRKSSFGRNNSMHQTMQNNKQKVL